eukprot:15356779-Ditylum_brightwellii.AAC.1
MGMLGVPSSEVKGEGMKKCLRRRILTTLAITSPLLPKTMQPLLMHTTYISTPTRTTKKPRIRTYEDISSPEQQTERLPRNYKETLPKTKSKRPHHRNPERSLHIICPTPGTDTIQATLLHTLQ